MACLMTASLAACGGDDTADTGASADGGNAGAAQDGGSADNGEIVKLVVWGVGTADTEDCNEVAAAISEITREKIGVEVELVRGQDGEQINLALTSGEGIDLLNYNNVNGQLAAIVRNNYATALDDLAEKYGQGALGVIDPVDLDACRFSGTLYTLPNMHDTSRSAGFAMRKDKSGVASPAHGFSWDSTPVLNQVTACNNVVSSYHTALRWGALDPAENLPKFIEELEAAGINEVIAEKQRQLDEFLAGKK